MRISDVTFDIETGKVLSRWNIEEYSGTVAETRGEDEKAWNKSQTAKSQAGLAAAGGYGASATANDPTSLFQGVAANPMSAEERAGRLSATGGAYDTMATKAGERTAKTRNSAGYGDLLDELARGKSRDMGQTTSALDSEAFNRKMAALGGLGNIYGTKVGAQTHLLTPGQPVKENSFWDDLIKQTMQSAGQVGAAAVAGCWIARAIYGETSWEAELIGRSWESWARTSRLWRVGWGLYLIFGEPLGWLVKRLSPLRWMLKPLFNGILLKALGQDERPCHIST